MPRWCRYPGRVQHQQRSPWGERVLAIVAFVAVHLVLAWWTSIGPNQPIGDVEILYRSWVTAGLASGMWNGIDQSSVYPVLAIVPMVVAAFGGVTHIVAGWLTLMAVLNAVAAVLLWKHRALGIRVVWWWLAFLLLLGPIGQDRIDTVATAVAMIGVVFVAARPAVASAVFAVAAWIKVWPAALVVPLLLRARHRAGVIIGAVGVTAVVVVVDLVLGGGQYLLSFIGAQAGRGLQVESLLATPFVWAASAHLDGATIYYDQNILAFEVTGNGTQAAAAVSTPLMIVLVLAAVVLAIVARYRGAPGQELAPLVAMVLVLTLIVPNKVGSPQYVGWLAVPIVWGLIAGRHSARRFRVPAILALPTALLTQLVYPWFYNDVLGAAPLMVTVLSVRNLLELAILVWAIVELIEVAHAGGDSSRFRPTVGGSLRVATGRTSSPRREARRGVRDTRRAGTMDA
jgi:hypothetical protein